MFSLSVSFSTAVERLTAGVVCSHFSDRVISWQIGRYDGVTLCTLCIGWRQKWRYDGVSICPLPPYHHVSHTRNCWGDGMLGNVLLRVTELLPRSAPHRQLSICLNFHNLSASTRPHHSLVNYTLDTLLLHIYNNNNESIPPTYYRLLRNLPLSSGELTLTANKWN